MLLRLLLILTSPLFVYACSETPPSPINYSGPTADWSSYGGAPGGGHFSVATQITPENVQELEQAWVYRSGDIRKEGETNVTYPNDQPLPVMSSAWQLTPLVLDGALFGCTPFSKVFALDAASGKQLWLYDPGVDVSKEMLVNCRGVSSWKANENSGQSCSHRIFMGTLDSRLIALDAKTGEPCEDFGEGGQVDLSHGISEHSAFEYSSHSPPAILGNKVIIGTMVLDRVRDDMPSGVVRAYDARSGELAWYWDPIPPGQEPQFHANGEPRYERGTTNVWSIISVDKERDLVFLPTGNTSTDFYGGQRNNLDYWSSSVVALNGKTGEFVWRFQMVHHDIWDYDTPAQPTLFDFERDGQTIPALAQPTKMGNLYLLNRETGEPLFPVEERPVPQNYAVPGEYLAPTQPFPTRPPPLHPTKLDPEDAWGLTFWDRNACRDKIASLRNEGIYTPPSLEGSVFYPSDFGGNNWGTPAIDHDRNIAVLNTRKIPAVLKLVPRDECEGAEKAVGQPQWGTPYCLGYEPLLSPLGFPCNEPPWGTLTGVDLNAGEVLWEVPLGTFEELAPWPVSLMNAPPSQVGGPAVTASGLTFIAGTSDHYLRAFNTQSGEELWRTKLPTGGHSTPMTYRSNEGGKQYVVIAVGGHFGLAPLGQKPGDYLIAFALPGPGDDS